MGGRGQLEVREVAVAFGAVRAVDGVSLTAAAGRITGLIGPNGAGKTTLFNAIAGELRSQAGQILLDGHRLDGLPPHRVFAAGLARTFQIPRPFAGMTVLENLMTVPARQKGERFWMNWIARGAVRAEERAIRARAEAIMEFCGLAPVARSRAGAISGGQQKLVELARALMAEPAIILLDEPGAGVNSRLLDHLVDRIRALNARGMTFLIIEHNMDVIGALCDQVLVMAAGRRLAEGPPAAVIRRPEVIEAYLGGAAA
ncbi:MAG: ABC transporter ATP-binding protein [Rhodobacteraceae bacterium]|nr:ABC transporter ATP-binding protein [Paracoccaceae bacterium]